MSSNALVTSTTNPEVTGLYIRDTSLDLLDNDYKTQYYVRDKGLASEALIYFYSPAGQFALPQWSLLYNSSQVFYSGDLVPSPWQANWIGTLDPEASMTVTEVPVVLPTFDLPAGVVSLMIYRHGSVANYLRLRNLGQI